MHSTVVTNENFFVSSFNQTLDDFFYRPWILNTQHAMPDVQQHTKNTSIDVNVGCVDKNNGNDDDDNNLFRAFELLRFSQHDVESMAMDNQAFHRIQKSLKQRGCVTNAFLSQSLHLYVKWYTEKKKRNSSNRIKETLL